MANWVERARRELRNSGACVTAETDETRVLAVSAVPKVSESWNFRVESGGISSGEISVCIENTAPSVYHLRTQAPPGSGEGPQRSDGSHGVESTITLDNRFRDAQEAAEERAAILEYESGLARAKAGQVAVVVAAYYRHVFGQSDQGCCYVSAGRICEEGKNLHNAYFTAAWDADSRKHSQHLKRGRGPARSVAVRPLVYRSARRQGKIRMPHQDFSGNHSDANRKPHDRAGVEAPSARIDHLPIGDMGRPE